MAIGPLGISNIQTFVVIAVSYLILLRIKPRKTVKNLREEKKENDFFRIRETDNVLMKFVRRFAFVLHAIFAAITWAFLWFVSSFSG